MSFWKRRRIAELLRSADGAPVFRRTARQAVAAAAARGGDIAVWASREPEDLSRLARMAGVRVARIEDGFIRSVGLGAGFLPGASIVLDRQGVYFDPRGPSDLETILAETEFPADLLDRARRLRDTLVARGVTKYNVGGEMPDLDAPAGVRRIFVPGQVEDDRSVILAGAGVRGNLDLLARVRASAPDAFIIYKPHPDVDAGYRCGGVPDAEALRYADRVVRDVGVQRLIAEVDEVHTLTSLSGFEALLRGRRVVVHGQPFYAGWGLTEDRAPVARRTRRLSLDQLVAGTLILYPRYIDPATGRRCGPEGLIERLAEPELWQAGLLMRLRQLQGALAGRMGRPVHAARARR